jgi:hypothetical protein
MSPIIVEIKGYFHALTELSQLNRIDLLVFHGKKHATEGLIGMWYVFQGMIHNCQLVKMECQEESMKLGQAIKVYLAVDCKRFSW